MQLVDSRFLSQECRGHRRSHGIVVSGQGIDGHADDRDVGESGLDFGCRLDSVHERHIDIP